MFYVCKYDCFPSRASPNAPYDYFQTCHRRVRPRLVFCPQRARQMMTKLLTIFLTGHSALGGFQLQLTPRMDLPQRSASSTSLLAKLIFTYTLSMQRLARDHGCPASAGSAQQGNLWRGQRRSKVVFGEHAKLCPTCSTRLEKKVHRGQTYPGFRTYATGSSDAQP